MATFSEALEAMKKTKSARRTSWTDKGLIKLRFGYLTPSVDDVITDDPKLRQKQIEAIERQPTVEPDLQGHDISLFIRDVTYPAFQLPHLVNDMDEDKGILYGWHPNMNDVLASDWEIV